MVSKHSIRTTSDRVATHPRRTERRQRAAERRESRASRSVEEQLELIVDRPGNSLREVSRLTGGTFTTATGALSALRNG